MRRRWQFRATQVVAARVGYQKTVRPWHESWGATCEEFDAGLRGDEHVADPASQNTRGITINVPPEQVWRWVVQLGADRGGF